VVTVTTMRAWELGVGSVAAAVGALAAGSGATSALAAAVGAGTGSSLAGSGGAAKGCAGSTAFGACSTGTLSGERRKNQAPPMTAAAATSSAMLEPPDDERLSPSFDVADLRGLGAGTKDLGAGFDAATGGGDGTLTASGGASQLSSSSSTGGGVDDGIVRGVAAVGDDAGTAAIAAGADASASQLSSSPSAVGGGQDIGIERGAEEGAAVGGTTEGDGIPISVPPLPAFRDGGAADAALAGGALAGGALGAGIPIRVCCLDTPPERGGELFATGAVDGVEVEGFGAGGSDPCGFEGSEGFFDARSSLMASSTDSSSTSDRPVELLRCRATHSGARVGVLARRRGNQRGNAPKWPLVRWGSASAQLARLPAVSQRPSPLLEKGECPLGRESSRHRDGNDQRPAGDASQILERKADGIFLHLSTTGEHPNAPEPI
jgi:hypothetical protein